MASRVCKEALAAVSISKEPLMQDGGTAVIADLLDDLVHFHFVSIIFELLVCSPHTGYSETTNATENNKRY